MAASPHSSHHGDWAGALLDLLGAILELLLSA